MPLRNERNRLVRGVDSAFPAYSSDQAAVAAFVSEESRQHAFGTQIRGIAAVNSGEKRLGNILKDFFAEMI